MNPMRQNGKAAKGGDGQKKEAEAAIDSRHLVRAMSGGFHKKPSDLRDAGGRGTGAMKREKKAAADARRPAEKTTAVQWSRHVDDESGQFFYEDTNGNTTWHEPFASKWSDEHDRMYWQSLVTGESQWDQPIGWQE